MLRVLLLLLALAGPAAGATTVPVAATRQAAAIEVAGRVLNASREPLAGATVRAAGATVTTDADGRFRLSLPGPATLTVTRGGFAPLSLMVTRDEAALEVVLVPLGGEASRRATAQDLEGLTVTAVRASGEAPIAQTTLDRDRIARDYTGQDIPLTLRQAPSVTAFSESGSLLNYSYFRLRGIDQSRINITLDGVPLNEPEDQQIYFSDFPDLTSSIEGMQVQRGVGTSTFGQAAFGGSVNFASKALAGTERGATVRAAAGSFGTASATLEARSGTLPNGLAVSGRLSGMRSEGYREGSSSAGNSAFVSAGYVGNRDLLKFTATTGLERNGQSYQAVTREELDANPRVNPLAGVGDHYRESMAMLSWTRLLSSTTSAGLTAYGFGTRGWYDYPTGGPERAYRWNTASRWGGVIAALHTTAGRLTIDGGAHGMRYSKDHEFADRPDLSFPGYANTGFKTEASAFAKLKLDLGVATLFGDAQVRTAEFRYEPTEGYGLETVSQRWTFVNPKVGVTVQATPRVSLFASFGTTGREPTRGDLFAGADDITPEDAAVLLPLDRVRPEHVNDLEAGITWSLPRLVVSVNGYDMRFRDEIARTGATTPLGYDLRANVGRSTRRGIEVDASWAVSATLDAGGSLTVSRNRIEEYVDEGSGTTYRDIEPILTPAVLFSHRLTWRASGGLTLTADGRYQGRSFLAPTGDEDLTAPPFYVLDGGAVFTMGGRAIHIQGRNLLNRLAFPSGDVSGGVPRFFILAPRSVDVLLQVTW